MALYLGTKKVSPINDAGGYKKGYELGKTDGIVEGAEQGRQDAYDTFWDTHQQNGNRTDYYYGFAGHAWTDETFKPKYPIVCGTAIAAFYENIGITRIPVSVELLSGVSAANLFTFCSKLKTIQLLKLCGSNAFNNNAFQNCTALESVTIEGEISSSLNLSWSSKISTASVQSIIDHLKDLTGATPQTLTLHADVGGKLTEEQKASITAKNWILVY